jgi:hypothetical protein
LHLGKIGPLGNAGTNAANRGHGEVGLISVYDSSRPSLELLRLCPLLRRKIARPASR